MAQHDYSIANQTFPATRSDINDALSAILSLNSGTTAPSTTAAGMLWYDTTNGLIKQRNAANSAWVTVFTVGKQGLIPQDGSTIYAADAEASDTYVITLAPVPAAYVDGMVINFKANTANTGAATLNVNSLGAKDIRKNYNEALATGDIAAGQIHSVAYDADNDWFQLLSAVPVSGSIAPKHIAGKPPAYASSATITLPAGMRAADSTNTYYMEVASAQTVSLATSGANGLDTGSEASNTWYYVYLIGSSTDSATYPTKGVFSVTNEAVSGSITLPANYDIKRQLPLAVRNDGSSNIIPFNIAQWGHTSKVLYNVWHDATGTGPTNVLYVTTSATTFTNVDCSAYIPPISRIGIFRTHFFFTGAAIHNIREDGQSHDGIEAVTQLSSNFTNETLDCAVSTSQIIEYKSGNSATDSTINVAGFYVTEV